MKLPHYSDFSPLVGKKMGFFLIGLIIGLLFFEFAVGYHYDSIKGSIYEDCYRTNLVGTTIEPFIDYIASSKAAGNKIVLVIGSSPAYGTSVNSSQTVSCYLSQMFPGVHFYNLARGGATSTDSYLIYSSVKGYANAIIYEDAAPDFYLLPPTLPPGALAPVTYPEYVYLPNVVDADSAGMNVPPHSSASLEYIFDGIAKGSALYRNRQLIQEQLFGTSPTVFIDNAKNYIDCALLKGCVQSLNVPFTQKSVAEQQLILNDPEIVNQSRVDSTAPSITYITAMATEQGSRMLFYMNPVNPLIPLNGSNYTYNDDFLHASIAGTGVRYIDLSSGYGFVPEDFTDSIHQSQEGNLKVAQILCPYLRSMISTGNCASSALGGQDPLFGG